MPGRNAAEPRIVLRNGCHGDPLAGREHRHVLADEIADGVRNLQHRAVSVGQANRYAIIADADIQLPTVAVGNRHDGFLNVIRVFPSSVRP